MAKVQKETTFLVSSAGTGFFYTARRNRKKIKGDNKVTKMKYDPIARKHVKFEEKKLSKLKKQVASAAKSEKSETETAK